MTAPAVILSPVRRAHVDLCITWLARTVGASEQDVRESRRAICAIARQALMLHLSDLYWPATDIAGALGRDHSTVSTGIKRGRRRLLVDDDLRDLYAGLPRWGAAVVTEQSLVALQDRLTALLAEAQEFADAIREQLAQEAIPTRVTRYNNGHGEARVLVAVTQAAVP